MITRMSKKLSFYFVKNEIVKEEDSEVYEYSLEIFFSTILNFFAVAVIAVFTKSILETIIYLLGFIPLRLIAGGFHAKTHFRCFLVLMGSYSTFLFAIRFIPPDSIVYLSLIASLISLVLIYILAPVEDKNKPVSPEEIISFRLKSRITIIVYVIVILLLLYLLSNQLIAFSLALGVLTVALSLLASGIRNKIENTVINAVQH